MKIYVTSNGFVASHIKNYFKDKITNNLDEADIIINTIGILKEGKYTYENSHIDTIKHLIPKVKNKKLIHFSALGSQINHPSKYKHTKAVAEQLIKENLTNYAILKPSIILGEGQKLYEDLEKFKNFPIVLAPKMRVAPIEIEKILIFIDKIIKEDLKGTFELCGDVMNMKELFKKVFNSFNKSPIIIEMPKIFFKVSLPILEKFDILTKDEYLMIEDNICKDKNV